MTALSHLNALLDAEMRSKYPHVPYLPPSKMKCNNANTLTQCVLKYIRVMGGQAERINTMGRRLDQTRVVTDCLGYKRQIGSVKFVPGTGTRGSADISATIKNKSGIGVSVKIEVKWAKDRISADQIKYAESVRKAGGEYIVVHDFTEFYNWYQEFTK